MFQTYVAMFQLFWTYVVNVLFERYKSRLDIAHVEWNHIAAAAYCSCWGAAERADGPHVRSGSWETSGSAGPAWNRKMSRRGKRGVGKRASTRERPGVGVRMNVSMSVIHNQ